jgi:parallel beta-helix repeat protein
MLLAIAFMMALTPTVAFAATDCTFTTSGSTMTLDNSCVTDATIVIPDGFTLDGAGNTITAVDPSAGTFLGAVIKNGGSTAYVTNLTVTASDLAIACHSSTPVDTRLRGILFEGASGSITKNNVIGINQGASGCQEGNAIEVRNAPFDGTHPATIVVEIAQNSVDDYQKTGILANGDVNVSIHHNEVGGSATQANLAANAIQLGFGAQGAVIHNQIEGNSWAAPSDVATAVLLYLSSASIVSQNNIGGNADVGIYIFGDNTTVDNNKVFEDGTDGAYDVGIGDYGSGNAVTNNKVKGYDTPYEGVNGGNNKAIPAPQDSIWTLARNRNQTRYQL